MKTANRSFWAIVVLVTLTLVAIDYAPLFIGKIPFPASIVLGFPPYQKVAPPGIHGPQADIGDLVTAFYPFRMIASRAMREGSLPLWNPYLLSGTPFLANAQSALFYPPNFLYYLLPLPAAWAIGFPLRLVLAALFTALFLRRIGASTAGSIVAAVLFAFCGFLTVWQGQPMADGAIWLPLICYSLVHLRAAPSLKRAALAALAFAMPVLAGHPETAIHLTLFGCIFALYLVLMGGPEPVWSRVNIAFMKCFVVAGLLAAGLAAVQLLPTAEWLKYANHSFVDTWPPLPLWAILAFVSRDVIRATNSIGLHIPEQAAYLGILTFLAAPLALLHPARRLVLFFALSTVAAISVVYGFGPLFWITQHAPILKIVKNHRMILFVDFSLAVLAGLGISVLDELHSSHHVQRFRAAILSALGGATALMMVFTVHRLTDQITEFVSFPRFSIYLLVASAVAIMWKLMGGLSGWRFGALILTVLAVDVLTFAYGSIEFTAPRDVFPAIELFDRINAMKPQPPFRIAQTGYAFGINFETMYGLSGAGGLDILLERIKRFTGDISFNDMASVMFTTPAMLENKDRRIDMLNTKYIIVSQYEPRYVEFRNQPDRFRFLFATSQTEVYENLKALPAAYLVPDAGIEIIPGEDEQLARLKNPAFDPEQAVLLSQPLVASEARASTAAGSAPSRVTWISKRTNDFELATDAGAPSVLVVSQVYYPGWKAFVDGQPVSVVPADQALTAIPVPAGSHAVRFLFDPLSFKLGLLLTAAAMFVALTLSIRT